MEVKRPKVKQNLVDKKINSSYLEEGALVLQITKKLMDNSTFLFKSRSQTLAKPWVTYFSRGESPRRIYVGQTSRDEGIHVFLHRIDYPN